MGFFDTIGQALSAPLNALGDITGVHINPFQGSVSTGSPSLNLNDIASLASLFGGGAIPSSLAGLGLGNVGLSSLLGASGLGSIGGLLGAAGRTGAVGGTAQPSGAYGFDPSNLDALRNSAIGGAFNALNPENYRQEVANYGNQAMQRANTSGRNQAARLRGAGYGSGAQQGAIYGAENNANEATNNYAQNIYSPQNMAKGYMSQLGVLNPSNIYANSLFNANMQLLGNRIAGSRPGSMFENALGSAGTGLGGLVSSLLGPKNSQGNIGDLSSSGWAQGAGLPADTGGYGLPLGGDWMGGGAQDSSGFGNWNI